MVSSSGGGDAAPPTVVFLDEAKWESFFQLAAKLRRSGVRCVRVTSVPQGVSRVASRLVFHRCVYLSPSRQEEVLRSVLGSENVIDLQFSENFADLVSRVATALPETIASRVMRRVQLIDKVSAGEFMQRSGASTPARLQLPSPDLDAFVATHGWPVVLKRRIGWGGKGVRIISDRGHLLDAIESLGQTVNEYFVEAFVNGERVNYGAALVEGTVAQEACYATTRTDDPVGPSTQIRTIDDTEVLDVGRRIVLASQCDGLMNINFMQDEFGVCWPVDFNIRIFGRVTSFAKAGLDFREGYLRSLGMATRVTASQPRAGVTLDSYPEAQRSLFMEGHPVQGLVSMMVRAPETARLLSWRYVALELLAFATLVRDSRRRSS